jgi:hypothetical protein
MTTEDDFEDETEFPYRYSISTRHKFPDPREGALDGPRIRRREGEPYSLEINYLWDVLHTNFPNHRVLLDLPHCFRQGTKRIDIQLDLSFFLNLSIPEKINSFDSSDFDYRIPELAINILTKATWRVDLVDNFEKCRKIKIPYYVVFFAYPIKNEIYPYPLLRLYKMNNDGRYTTQDLTDLAIDNDVIVSQTAFLDCEPLPFRIGLAKIPETFIGGKPLYRMILLKKNIFEVYNTKAELAESKAKEAESKAKEAEIKSQETKKENEMLKKQIEELEKRLKDKN